MQLKPKSLFIAMLGALPFMNATATETVNTQEVKVTASRVAKELMDVNMAVSVVTAEDIRRSNARNVGELLADIPGVQIMNDGGQGMKRISIRGENAFRTLILIDGQKMAEHKSMSGAPLLIDPSQIERIEVIKGPASVLYGSDALGGVINIITKKAANVPLQADVSMGYESAAKGRSGAVTLSGTKDGLHYRVNASAQHQGSLDTPMGEMPHTFFSSKGASAFVAYDVNPDMQVGGSLEYYDLSFGSGDITTPGFAVDVPDWKRMKAAVFLEQQNLTDTLVRVRTDAFFQRSDKSMTNTVMPAPGMKVQPIAENTTDQLGFSVQTDWQLGERHYLVSGYEFEHDHLDADSITRGFMRPNAKPMVMGDKTYDGYQQSHAVYASMESELIENVTANYGLRYTWVKTDMDTTDNKKQKTTHGDGTDSKLVFNAGLLWRADEHLTFRANYAQGYRSPILQELYIDTAMGLGSGTTYANPNLKPETSDTYELGMRWTSNVVTSDLTLFYSEADDYISTAYVATLNGNQYQNVDHAKTIGAEWCGSVRIAETGFEPYASFTWLEREYEGTNGFTTKKTGKPKFTGRYGVRWSGMMLDHAVRTDLYGQSQTKREYEDATGKNNYVLAGYTTLNMTAGVDFGPKNQYSLDVGFFNVFDKGYRQQLSIYEPGRNVTVKLNARF